MKKLLVVLGLGILLVGCGDGTSSTGQEVLVNVNEFYNLTLDQAQEQYGDLQDYGSYTNESGIDTNIYMSTDNRYEFYFSPDGQKLHALYVYGEEDEFTVIREAKIAESLGLVHGPDASKNKSGVPRYFDVDNTEYIKEVYFVNSGKAEFPLTVDMIQIWFK